MVTCGLPQDTSIRTYQTHPSSPSHKCKCRVPHPAHPTPSLQGYVDEKLERLRRGIGPEDIGLVDNIAPSEVPGLLREELPQLKE